MTTVKRQTARVIPVNRHGHVLLLFGQDPARPDHPYWFTIGGAVEPQETLTAAAVRELREETGIRIDEAQLVGPIHRGTHAFSFDSRDHVSDSTFFAAVVDDIVISFAGLEESEVGNIFEARWWDPVDLAAETPMSNPELPAITQLAVDAITSLPTAGGQHEKR